MKTSIIEILKTIAEGRIPPKKILFKDEEYLYHKTVEDYYNENEGYLFDSFVITDILTDSVYILEASINITQEDIDNIRDFLNKYGDRL